MLFGAQEPEWESDWLSDTESIHYDPALLAAAAQQEEASSPAAPSSGTPATCPCCLELYGGAVQLALLKCHHVHCLSCCKGIAATNAGRIPCALCRKVTPSVKALIVPLGM